MQFKENYEVNIWVFVAWAKARIASSLPRISLALVNIPTL